MIARRWAASLAAAALLAASCVGGRLKLAETPSSGRAGQPDHATGPPSQVNPLCRPVPSGVESGPVGGSLPPAIAQVADEVEEVRGLRFREPVAPEPLSQEEMQQELKDSLEEQFPADIAAREGETLITIGAVPDGTDLQQVLIDYGSSQIIGFYDTGTRRLVFLGGEEPTPFERYVLAHELTHALQDQNFDLTRLDRLNNTCQDERAEAFLSLAEGDAVETQVQWARANLTEEEILQLQEQANSFPPPPPVPPFVEDLFLFPYPNGQAFVEALQAEGGERAVDDAYRDPPVSTEQILHPEKYPDDVPQAVEIPDLSSRLGQGWSLLNQEDVGEGWLLTLLELRLSDGDSQDAAAGWDGGLLRAWSDGSSTAVTIKTVWDSEREAGEFADAMNDWIGQEAAEVTRGGTGVQVLFASDPATLAALSAVAAA